MKRILVTGASGQIGSELIPALGRREETDVVVGTDLRAPAEGTRNGLFTFEMLDVRDRDRLGRLVSDYRIDTVFHLASLLSATGERKPELAWEVNLDSLRHVLDVARAGALKVFWPSSIAVFGPASPRVDAPQSAALDPSTIYGITKVSGELLCRYYHQKFGVDVRSVRYPGVISYRTRPGGGTTDYAVEIFYAAVEGEPYTCFVGPETRLPMMYMPDAIRATLELMAADPARVRVRTSYNLAALSFSVRELADEIARRVPGFAIRYEPDARQAIADSWPASIDDREARADWGWAHHYTLPALVDDMLAHLREKVNLEV